MNSPGSDWEESNRNPDIVIISTSGEHEERGKTVSEQNAEDQVDKIRKLLSETGRKSSEQSLRSTVSVLERVGGAPELPEPPPDGGSVELEEVEEEVIKQTWQDLASKIIYFDRWTRLSRPRYLDIGPPPRDHMRVNVSGTVFDIPRRWIDKFPGSLFCSPDMGKLYNSELGVYFVDRNRTAFEHILQYMASDKKLYQFPDCIPSELLEMELEYYRIGWRFIIGSCSTEPVDNFLNFRTYREKSFAFFNYPESSLAAKVYMYIDLVFILVSIVEFMLLTDPEIIKLRESSSSLELLILTLKWMCLVFFTTDIILRSMASLDRLKFILDYTVWFDILSLFPFYADIFHLPETGSGGWIQLLKMARISRCMKIIRRSETLLMIINILVSCGAELGLLGFVWLLGVIVSGTLLYFAENQLPVVLYNDTRAAHHNISTQHSNGTVTWAQTEWFYSIMESCWQAVVVIGTVGYGNVYPVYAIGKFVAAGIIFLSSLLMAIPMTIIIKRFSLAYEQRAQETRVRKVFGGKFTEDEKHVVEVEDRQVSSKQRHTARCIERFRSGKSKYQDIKQFVSKRFPYLVTT